MADQGLTDEQARALWQRAAELQAAAEHAAARARALQPVEQGDLTVEQVTAAAEGAGIDADFVRIAVAEQQLSDAEALRHDKWQGRWLQRIVQEQNVIERERVITAAPEDVLAAFRTVAASSAYQLMPESTVGRDPVRDAVFVYRLTHSNLLNATSSSFSATMNFADARVLLVMVRPHERGALIRIRVPLYRRGTNLGLSGFSAALFGTAGGGALGWGAVALGASALVAAAPVAIGAAAGGAFGVAGFRAMYRSATKQATTAVDMLLQAVAVEAGTNGH